jgi:DNA (cytosine-5)-methyltransferase 1
MTSITIGSLFSGIGGLDLAVESVTGGRVAWQCERDKYARSVLARHWPGLPIFEDIKKLHDAPAVDALCGGFPCQDISLAGNRGGIKHGEKSGLWREFARIIREVRPRYVFLENVAAITSAGLDAVLGDLATCGFNAEWGCLRACDIGAPHIRNRWFLFGWLANSDRAGRWVRGRQPRERHHSDRGSAPMAWPPGFRDDEGWRRWQRDGLSAPVIRRGPDGFPAGLDVPKQLRCLGNAVVPQQGEEAFRQLIERSGQ